MFKWVFDAGHGVRTFFIISGFLITWLMLVEHDQAGRVNLRYFYVRRGLRILPVYFAFLCALAGLQLFTAYRQSAGNWLGNATFTTNFISHATWTSGHLWSLAVEEQFYLLWPGVFVLLGLARNLRRAGWILAMPLALAPMWRVVSYLGLAPAFLRPLYSPYSFFNFFDSLAIGCLCAFVFSRRRGLLHDVLTPRPWLVLALALGLIIAPHVLQHWLILGVITVPFGPTLQASGMALLLLQSLVMPAGSFYRLLDQPLLCLVGVLSYSIYIWQQIFCSNPEEFGLGRVWWMSFPGWLIPVLAVSLVSYYGLERPLFRLRSRFRN